MTEKERIVENLQKILLNEQALSKQDFTTKIVNIYSTVVNHLTAILLFPNNQEVNHWKREIYDNFSRFTKLKSTNKFPNAEQFMKYGIDDCFEDLDYHMKDIILSVYNKETDQDLMNIKELKNIDIDKIRDLIKEYFIWCINNVSRKDGTINRQDAYNKINEIMQKCNS